MVKMSLLAAMAAIALATPARADWVSMSADEQAAIVEAEAKLLRPEPTEAEWTAMSDAERDAHLAGCRRGARCTYVDPWEVPLVASRPEYGAAVAAHRAGQQGPIWRRSVEMVRAALATGGEFEALIAANTEAFKEIDPLFVNVAMRPPAVAIRKGGDCESFALYSYLALIEAGWPAERLRLVAHRTTHPTIGHLIVAARRADGQVLIIDSRRPGVAPRGEIAWGLREGRIKAVYAP